MSIAQGELTSMAFCWRAERSDGAGLALTSHDRALQIEGTWYRPDAGITPAAVTRQLGLNPHNSEISGGISADCLRHEDLAAGRWDGAAVRLFAADWAAPESETIELLSGRLGEVGIEDNRLTAELRGAAALLEGPVCPSTSPECRADFGDKACRVDLAGRSRRATIMESNGNEIVLGEELSDTCRFGRLRYLSGGNSGAQTTILTVTGATLMVRDPPRATIVTGCTVEVREGCDKRLQTCSQRFQNAVNFRGEPHLPGNDLLTRYPGA